MFALEKQSLGNALSKKKNKRAIILASSSPRRKDLLRPYYRLKICPSNCDERKFAGESAQKYVRRISLAKWKIVANQFSRPQLVVAADTIVVLGAQILGKPANQIAAEKMLKALSGKTHLVLSAVAVGWSSTRKVAEVFVVSTRVTFRKILDDELQTYLSSNQWRGKAGSYAVQGGALKFTSKIEGSLTSVVGLPLDETLRRIEKKFTQSPQ